MTIITHSQAENTFKVPFGASIAYQEFGETKNPPVILIHGFPVNHEMWNSQVDVLKNHFHVITYDLRGLGKSQVTDTQYTLEFMVDDLFALQDHLGLKKTAVVGFSMGGYIALRGIERDPTRFQSLALIDTQSAADSDAAKLKRTAALKAIKGTGLRAYAEGFAQGALSQNTLSARPEIAREIIRMTEANTASGVSSGLLALISRSDTSGALAQIKVPTLILVGEHDAVTPPQVAKEMSQKIFGSEIKQISQAGHFSPLENTEEVNLLLKAFLLRVQ